MSEDDVISVCRTRARLFTLAIDVLEDVVNVALTALASINTLVVETVETAIDVLFGSTQGPTRVTVRSPVPRPVNPPKAPTQAPNAPTQPRKAPTQPTKAPTQQTKAPTQPFSATAMQPAEIVVPRIPMDAAVVFVI